MPLCKVSAGLIDEFLPGDETAEDPERLLSLPTSSSNEQIFCVSNSSSGHMDDEGSIHGEVVKIK